MAGVVVIGGGLAGHAVLREFRRLDKQTALTLIAADSGDYYSKPALSTALAKGKLGPDLVSLPGARLAGQLGFELVARTAVSAIDRSRRVVVAGDREIGYDRLVLALGAAPVPIRLAGDAAGDIVSVNDLDDYIRFRERLRPGGTVAIVGGGLVGCEFANDLSQAGYRVTVVDPLETPMALLLPREVGLSLQDALAAQGVEWRLGRSAASMTQEGGRVRLGLSDGSSIAADLVVAAVGLRPRIALAEAAGLAVGRGIAVDMRGASSDPDIFAIGDCAEYPIGLCHYITPILHAARAIAGCLVGRHADIAFPVLSVTIKTTALPISLLRPPAEADGSWRCTARDASGSVHLFHDRDDHLRGYVLTGARSDERTAFDEMVRSGGAVLATA